MEENKYKKYFNKAKEYYKNAKDILKEVEIEYGKFYKNQKKVQKSAALCYLSLNYAMKGYLIKKGIDEKKVIGLTWDGLKSYIYKYYPTTDHKFRNELEAAYRIVHIDIYYTGRTVVSLVKEGYNSVKYVIEKLVNEKI